MTFDLGEHAVRQVPVVIRFAQFLLVEPFSVKEPDPVAWAYGLLEPGGARSGMVRCRTGHKTERALVSIDVSCGTLESDLSFDDVVEMSYRPTAGELNLADWQRRLAHPPTRLPWGGSWCRLRYHLRGMTDDGVGECLIQIWPAEPTPPSTVKISTNLGRFWHPGAVAAPC
jgi:hypothetical protein